MTLVLSTRERSAINRNFFNPFVWKKALRAVGIADSRENGCHARRHFYASTLLDAGESIKALNECLGHADPGFTLRTYTHLMSASDERTRRAVDAVLCVPQSSQDAERQTQTMHHSPYGSSPRGKSNCHMLSSRRLEVLVHAETNRRRRHGCQEPLMSELLVLATSGLELRVTSR